MPPRFSEAFQSISINFSQFKSVSINFNLSKLQEFIDNQMVRETTLNRCAAEEGRQKETSHFVFLLVRRFPMEPFLET